MVFGMKAGLKKNKTNSEDKIDRKMEDKEKAVKYLIKIVNGGGFFSSKPLRSQLWAIEELAETGSEKARKYLETICMYDIIDIHEPARDNISKIIDTHVGKRYFYPYAQGELKMALERFVSRHDESKGDERKNNAVIVLERALERIQETVKIVDSMDKQDMKQEIQAQKTNAKQGSEMQDLVDAIEKIPEQEENATRNK